MSQLAQCRAAPRGARTGRGPEAMGDVEAELVPVGGAEAEMDMGPGVKGVRAIVLV